MQKLFVFLLIVCCCSSCFLFKKYKQEEFLYTQDGTEKNLALLLPKGFQNGRQIVDSAGNIIKTYQYSNGSTVYFAAMKDTSVALQAYDTVQHVALPHAFGGLMYKGISPDWRIWREIRNKQFRAGYYQVPVSVEGYFDSSLNYAAREFRQGK